MAGPEFDQLVDSLAGQVGHVGFPGAVAVPVVELDVDELLHAQSYRACSGERMMIGSPGPMTVVVGAFRKKNGRQPPAGISPCLKLYAVSGRSQPFAASKLYATAG
jgi:hypothetical protein